MSFGYLFHCTPVFPMNTYKTNLQIYFSLAFSSLAQTQQQLHNDISGVKTSVYLSIILLYISTILIFKGGLPSMASFALCVLMAQPKGKSLSMTTLNFMTNGNYTEFCSAVCLLFILLYLLGLLKVAEAIRRKLQGFAVKC